MARTTAQRSPGASEGPRHSSSRSSQGGAGLLVAGASLGMILVAGFVLYSARGALGGWLAALPELSAEQPPVPAVEVAGPDTFTPTAPTPPKPTYDELAAALLPLADGALALVEEGRGELPEFADLASEDEVRLRQMRSRWRAWGRIWRNRLGVLERQLPPADAWAEYDDLTVTATVIGGAFAFLRAVPAAADIQTAGTYLDEASSLAALVQPRQPPAAPAIIEPEPRSEPLPVGDDQP